MKTLATFIEMDAATTHNSIDRLLACVVDDANELTVDDDDARYLVDVDTAIDASPSFDDDAYIAAIDVAEDAPVDETEKASTCALDCWRLYEGDASESASVSTSTSAAAQAAQARLAQRVANQRKRRGARIVLAALCERSGAELMRRVPQLRPRPTTSIEQQRTSARLANALAPFAHASLHASLCNFDVIAALLRQPRLKRVDFHRALILVQSTRSHAWCSNSG
jgi:hypothetical protein